MPGLIPYVINMCCMKNIYGFAVKVNLNYKILEEIAEQMVFSISDKLQSIDEYIEKIGNHKNVEVVYFEHNRWNHFDIDQHMLIILYTEKYNNYYVESEECEDEHEDELLSYSYENENTSHWKTLLEMHNEEKQRIYERHLHLCYHNNNEHLKLEFELDYISSSSDDESIVE